MTEGLLDVVRAAGQVREGTSMGWVLSPTGWVFVIQPKRQVDEDAGGVNVSVRSSCGCSTAWATDTAASHMEPSCQSER